MFAAVKYDYCFTDSNGLQLITVMETKRSKKIFAGINILTTLFLEDQ